MLCLAVSLPAMAQFGLGANGRLQRGVALGRRFQEDRMLLIVLHGAFPAVNRAARRENVHARGEPAFDQQVGESLGRGAIGKIRQDQQGRHER